jgi:hypothetical protein
MLLSNFTFCLFLVGGNRVSKYEQLLILTGIDASTLPCSIVDYLIDSSPLKTLECPFILRASGGNSIST